MSSVNIEDMCKYIKTNNRLMFDRHINTIHNINTLHKNMTMLGYALYYKRDFFAEKLLAKDDINVEEMFLPEDDEMTSIKGTAVFDTLSPFHCAIINGRLPFVIKILENAKDRRGLLTKYCKYKGFWLTAFQTAVYAQQHEIFRYLIDVSETIQEPICYTKVVSIDKPTNVLELAAYLCQFETVKFLLDLKTISWKEEDRTQNKLLRGNHAFLLNKDSPVWCGNHVYHPMYIAIEHKKKSTIQHLAKCACPMTAELREILPKTPFSTSIQQSYQIRIKRIKKKFNLADKNRILDKNCIICQEKFKSSSHISEVTGCDCAVGQHYHTNCLIDMMYKLGVKCSFCSGYIEKYSVVNNESKKRKKR